MHPFPLGLGFAQWRPTNEETPLHRHVRHYADRGTGLRRGRGVWPTKAVRIVCPFTPGGSQNNMTRRHASSRASPTSSWAATERALKESDVIESMKHGGFGPTALSVTEADAFIRAVYKRWGEVIRGAGIKPQ